MPEIPRSEHVTPTKYDNLVLKQWLRDKGEAGRREALTKLKADLQTLGLSRRQVRRGLLQLATKPRVIVCRYTACRRPKLEKYEKPIDDDKTDAAFFDRLPKDEDTQTPDSTQEIIDEHEKRDEEVKTGTEVSTSDKSISSKSCELERQTPHSFDKALEKIDSILSPKTNIVNMNSKRSSVIISAADAFRSRDKNDAMNNNNNNTEKTRTKEMSDLTCDMVGQGIVCRPDRRQKNRIKLNLKSFPDRKRSNAKSVVHKKLDTAIKSTRVQVDSASDQTKRAKQRDDVSTDIAMNTEDYLNKRKLYEVTVVPSCEPRRKKIRASADERKVHDRKISKNIKYKFRSCFGDCGTLSEDEQEQHILQKRLKRRRKKDSVDSCDSGVYFSETNTINSNCIEILKDIQKAVPDSTMDEDIGEDSSSCGIETDTIDATKNIASDENVKLTNDVEKVTNDADKISQNDKCDVGSEVENDEVRKQFDGIENNLVQSTTVLNDTETSSQNEKSNIDVPVLQDSNVDNNVSPSSTPKVCNCNPDTNITASLSQPATGTTELRDLSKLLDMDFNEICQVSSNGNVLSIKEKTTTDADQDAFNNNIKDDLQLILANCDQSIDQRELNVMSSSPSKDVSCFDANKDVTSIPVRINLCDLLGDANAITLPNNKLDDTEQKDEASLPNSESTNVVDKEATIEPECNVVPEKKNETAVSDSNKENQNTQPNKVPRIKLRVLSSAELGSRWCPTPVNPVISTTSVLSSTNTVVTSDTDITYSTNNQESSSSTTTEFEGQPMRIPVISTTGNVSSSGDVTSPNNLKKTSMDPKFSEGIYNSLVCIYRLIISIRASRVDHSTLLIKEFENLRKMLNSEDYINLISAVIDILNKELLVSKPLTLKELLHYVPSFTLLYGRKIQDDTNSNVHKNTIPTVRNNTIKQTMHNNSQGVRSTISVQNVLQKVFSVCTVQTPVSTNVMEKAPVQPQNNLMQNNVPMNSTATNYGMQQPNFRIPLQACYRQPRPPPPNYFVRQHSVPVQHVPLVVNPNETGIRYGQQFSTAPYLYSYLMGGNTHGNVNAPNYIPQQTMQQNIQQNIQQNMQQTMPQTMPQTNVQNVRKVPSMGQPTFQNQAYRQTAYMPQEVQPQMIPQFPQNIPVINDTAQVAQNNFVSSAPKLKKLMPKYTQRNEARQNRCAQVQTQIPPNVPSKQTSSMSSQQTQAHNKQNTTAQVSLESTVKQFAILKYLSDIQKIMLLKQMNFYFGCTTWLQQQFTTKQWQIINLQRSALLHFQTLLKHFVQNAINSISSNVSQSNSSVNNVLANIENNVQKVVQITVQGNEEIHCPVSTSNTEEEQRKITNTDRSNVLCQKNSITSTSKNQLENEENVASNLPDKELSNQTRESETLQNKEIQRNEQTEQTLVQRSQPIVISNLETQKILDSNIKQKPEGSIDSGNQQNLNNCVQVICDVPYVVQEAVPIISNLEELCKNTLHQLSTDLTTEQNVNNSIKLIHDVPYAINNQVPIISNLNVLHKDTVQQPNPHLVTVQISPNNYEVRVIDTNTVGEKKDKGIELVSTTLEEYQQLEEKHNPSVSSCLENNTCNNFSEENSQKISANTTNLSNEDTNNSLLEGITISQIADVRSITLEAFEEMEESNNIPGSSNSGENITEEDVKICLSCGKPSSVTCTVCLEANYCSKECIRLHWEEHLQDCKPAQKVKINNLS